MLGSVRSTDTLCSKPKDVEIPHMQETIDWCEPSPPPVHGFEESPIVVEFEYEE